MVGLLILKHLRNVSDETVVAQFSENAYYHKDNRGRKSDADQTAFIDSTVQEKNVTFPTDSKLLNKVIKFCRKVAEIFFWSLEGGRRFFSKWAKIWVLWSSKIKIEI